MNITLATNLVELKKKRIENNELENIILSSVLNGAEMLSKTAVQNYNEWEIVNFTMNLDFVHKCMVDEYMSDEIHNVSQVSIDNVKHFIKLFTEYIKSLLEGIQRYNNGLDESLQIEEDITIFVVGEPSVSKKLVDLLNKSFVEKRVFYSERDINNRPIYIETIDFLGNFNITSMEGLNAHLVRNYKIGDMDLLDPVEISYTVSGCMNMPRNSLD